MRPADFNEQPQITSPHHKLRSYHAAGQVISSPHELISEPELRDLLLASPHYAVSGDLHHVNLDSR